MEKPISLEQNNKDPALDIWKVKLFLLNSEGTWDDYGCGILSFKNEYNEDRTLTQNDYIYIEKSFDENDNNLVIDEEKVYKMRKNASEKMRDCLLFTKIEKDYSFERQHDYIISWIDKNLEEEIAISFIDPIAANETWKKISSIAQIQLETPMNLEDLQIFPKLNIENLDVIITQLESNKEKMIKSALYKQDELFEDLALLFEKAESEMNEDLMKKLITLIKSLIYSGDNDLIEAALNDRFYLTIYGILEYDGAEKMDKKSQFRKFLTEQIVFKKVVDINNTNILNKIHLNYRINFLYDCILEPIMDEARPNPFTKIIYYNNCEILDYFLGENLLLDRFCQNFLTKIEDSLEFLKELLDLVKANIQVKLLICIHFDFSEKPSVRSLLMEKFEGFGFFDILVMALPKIKASQMVQEKRIKYLILLIENFSYLMQIKTKPLIDIFYCRTDKEKGRNFISNLVDLLLFEDEGVQIQVTEFIKQLLDPLNEEMQQILTYMYDVLFVELYQAYERMLETETFYFFAQQYIDILIFCIQVHHHTRIRYYIIKNEIIQHILKGLGLKQKIILLVIAKFFKALIQSKDEFIIRYLETKHLIKPLMDFFSGSARKSQMFQSVMLDIITVIYSEDHDGLKKECEVYPIMASPLVKNVIKNTQYLKEKRVNSKDFRINVEFSNENSSAQNKTENNLFVKKGILNLNLLDEDDSDMIINNGDEFDHSQYVENSTINKKVTNNGNGENHYNSRENDNNLIKEKRTHLNNEEFSQIEQDMTRIKKVKLD